jgi:hypothetical protein
MGNDFTQDPSVKALWRLESGALTVDSIGNNTLTAANNPTADGSTFWEGTASAYFIKANDAKLYIPDASLDAGFPLKSGDSVKKISFCFWVKPHSSGYSVIVGKKDWNLSKVSLALCIRDNNQFFLSWGYQAGQYEEYLNLNTATLDHVYHIGVVVDGVKKAAYVRVWDVSAGTVLGYSKIFSHELYVIDSAWAISGGASTSDPFGGWVDEVVVFNRLITPGEIDAIRQGAFPLAHILPVSHHRFESGALTEDVIGNNSLIPVGNPQADTVDFKEGAASVNIVANGNAFNIPDANLDSGFPFKNGQNNKQATFCFWIKLNSAQNYNPQVIQKSNCFMIYTDGYGGTIKLAYYGVGWGWDVWYILGLTTGRWYHIGVRLDADGHYANARIWDDVAQNVNNYFYSFVAYPIGINTNQLNIGYDGSGGWWNGKLDQLVIFNAILTDDDIDGIRNKTYNLFPPPTCPDNCTSVTTCEALAQAVDKCTSETAAEEITLPRPEPCVSETDCTNLARSEPGNCSSETRCQETPLTHAGMFLIF